MDTPERSLDDTRRTPRWRRWVAGVSLLVAAVLAIPSSPVEAGYNSTNWPCDQDGQYGTIYTYYNPESGYVSATIDVRGTACDDIWLTIWWGNIAGCGGGQQIAHQMEWNGDGYLRVSGYAEDNGQYWKGSACFGVENTTTGSHIGIR